MRSQMAARLSRSCVTMRTVRCMLRFRSAMRASNSAAAMGSRPAVGSSRKRSSGSSARARATTASLRRVSSEMSASERARCSRSGTWMFCATLSELKSAPSWKSTPKRASKLRRSSAPSAARSSPRIVIRPEDGRKRPTRARSSTDLPAPEAPTTPSTSPRRTSRSRFSSTTRPSTRMVSPRTTMAGSAVPPGLSDAEIGEGDREEGISDDDQENRFDDGPGGEAPDAFGAARDPQPFIAAGEGDDAGEYRRFQHANPESPAGQRRAELAQERWNRDVEGAPRHQGAAEQAHNVGVEGDERQRQQQGEDARQDQDLDRVEAEDLHGVDLLIDLHRADLRREGAARAAGDDDGGEHDAELAQDGDAEQVDGVELGAEAPQLVGALEGEDDADEEGEEPDDGQRVDPRLLHMRDERRKAQPARPPQRAQRHDADESEKAEEFGAALSGTDDRLADSRREVAEAIRRRPGVGKARRRIALGDLLEERHEGIAEAGTLDGGAGGAQLVLKTAQEPRAGGVERRQGAEIEAREARVRPPGRADLAIERGGGADDPSAARLEDQPVTLARGAQPAALAGHPATLFSLGRPISSAEH